MWASVQNRKRRFNLLLLEVGLSLRVHACHAFLLRRKGSTGLTISRASSTSLQMRKYAVLRSPFGPLGAGSVLLMSGGACASGSVPQAV